jgi:hypothetical protein
MNVANLSFLVQSFVFSERRKQLASIEILRWKT